MKRFIITSALILGIVFAGTVQAQDFDDIYKKYKKDDNITAVKINKLGCLFASLFTSNDDGFQSLVKKSSAVRVLINENINNSALQNDLQKYIRKSHLEQLMSIKDGGDNIEFYILEKKKNIRELLITVTDEEEQVIVHLSGKYPLKIINEIMNDENSSISIKASM